MSNSFTHPRATSRARRSIAEATQRPGRFPHASLGTLIWITIVWVMLWGDLSLGNVLGGFLLALVITTVAPFPFAPFDGRFRPRAVVILLACFVRDIIHASFQQAWFVITGKEAHGAIIRIRLRSHSDSYLTMTAGMSSLVPGSLVVDSHRSTGTLYMHVFDVNLAGGVDGIHRTVHLQEERILRAFASRSELIEAGYVPGWSTKFGRLPVPYAPAADDVAAGSAADSAAGGTADSTAESAKEARP